MTVDLIGSWVSLGEPGLALGRWFIAPIPSDNPRGLLRLSFTFYDEKFDGYILFRNKFNVEGVDYFTTAVQVYPDTAFTLVKLPYPEELELIGITERYVQARPRAYNRRYGAGFNPVELSVRVEELI
jgi:hypothetical protein